PFRDRREQSILETFTTLAVTILVDLAITVVVSGQTVQNAFRNTWAVASLEHVKRLSDGHVGQQASLAGQRGACVIRVDVQNSALFAEGQDEGVHSRVSLSRLSNFQQNDCNR